jgi:hypothetical protein
VRLPLVLHLEAAAEPIGPWMGVGETRRIPFSEGDDVTAIVGIVNVQR